MNIKQLMLRLTGFRATYTGADRKELPVFIYHPDYGYNPACVANFRVSNIYKTTQADCGYWDTDLDKTNKPILAVIVGD